MKELFKFIGNELWAGFEIALVAGCVAAGFFIYIKIVMV